MFYVVVYVCMRRRNVRETENKRSDKEDSLYVLVPLYTRDDGSVSFSEKPEANGACLR